MLCKDVLKNLYEKNFFKNLLQKNKYHSHYSFNKLFNSLFKLARALHDQVVLLITNKLH